MYNVLCLRAQPPLLPYLALTMNDLICVSEGAPTYLEGNLINFTKMRRVCPFNCL